MRLLLVNLIGGHSRSLVVFNIYEWVPTNSPPHFNNVAIGWPHTTIRQGIANPTSLTRHSTDLTTYLNDEKMGRHIPPREPRGIKSELLVYLSSLGI